MSQLELESIGEVLEDAVLRHQAVIEHLQKDPANTQLKCKVIGIQNHIQALSNKQKIIIQDQREYLAESESRPDNYEDYNYGDQVFTTTDSFASSTSSSSSSSSGSSCSSPSLSSLASSDTDHDDDNPEESDDSDDSTSCSEEGDSGESGEGEGEQEQEEQEEDLTKEGGSGGSQCAEISKSEVSNQEYSIGGEDLTSEVSKSEGSTSEANKSEVNKSDVNKSEANASEVIKSEDNKSDVSKSEVSNSEANKSDVSKSEVSNYEANKSEVIKSEASASDVSKSEANKSEASTFEASASDVSKSEASNSEVIKSEVIKSEVNNSEVIKSEVSASDVSKSEADKSEVIKSEASASDVSKFEANKSEASASEVNKSEVSGSEVSKSEVSKSDVSRSEVSKSDVSNQEYSIGDKHLKSEVADGETLEGDGDDLSHTGIDDNKVEEEVKASNAGNEGGVVVNCTMEVDGKDVIVRLFDCSPSDCDVKRGQGSPSDTSAVSREEKTGDLGVCPADNIVLGCSEVDQCADRCYPISGEGSTVNPAPEEGSTVNPDQAEGLTSEPPPGEDESASGEHPIPVTDIDDQHGEIDNDAPMDNSSDSSSKLDNPRRRRRRHHRLSQQQQQQTDDAEEQDHPPLGKRKRTSSQRQRSMSSGYAVHDFDAQSLSSSPCCSSPEMSGSQLMPSSAYDIQLQAAALRDYRQYIPKNGYVAPLSSSVKGVATSLTSSELAKLHYREEEDADINNTQLLIKTANEMATSEEEREKLNFLAHLNLNTPEVIAATKLKRSKCDKRLLKFDTESNGMEGVDYIIPVPGPNNRRRAGRPRKASRFDDEYDQVPYKLSCSLEYDPIRAADHEDFCQVCMRSGDLLMCDTCTKVYHLVCLEPPLESVPAKSWICHCCLNRDTDTQTRMKQAYNMISDRLEKERQIAKNERIGLDLSIEKNSLENKIKDISSSQEALEQSVETAESEKQNNEIQTKRIKLIMSGQYWINGPLSPTRQGRKQT